jgi:uncharacterized protein YgbK (DUF1537 family)
MTGLVIIADDLTGAADSAALLVRRGRTSVVIDPGGDWPADEVLSVDTDSRHCSPDVAAGRVALVTDRARQLGAQVVKKIDSTLRGNVVAELRAMTEACSRDGERVLLVVAPAFPATGRTTVGGVVHVDGERLAAHGSDGDVVALLGRGGLQSVLLRAMPQQSPVALATHLDAAHDAGHAAVVVDATSDEQLATVVEASRRASRPVLLVGSGGLTRPLAGPASPTYEGPGAGAIGHTLVVVGSYAATSRVQRERLVAHGHTAVTLDDNHAATVDRLREALLTGTAVLSPDPDAPVVRAQAPQVARALADAVLAVLPDIGTLVATGGETARAVLVAAGVGRLQVVGECEPGVVRSHAPDLGFDVITKAGGFGDPDALLRCLHSRATVPEKESTP